MALDGPRLFPPGNRYCTAAAEHPVWVQVKSGLGRGPTLVHWIRELGSKHGVWIADARGRHRAAALGGNRISTHYLVLVDSSQIAQTPRDD